MLGEPTEVAIREQLEVAIREPLKGTVGEPPEGEALEGAVGEPPDGEKLGRSVGEPLEGAVQSPTEIEYRENTFSYILVHNYVIWPFQLCFFTLVFL